MGIGGTLVSAIAGCSESNTAESTESDERETTDSTTDEATETDDVESSSGPTVVEDQAPPSELEFSASVQRQASESDPARLRVELENPGPKPVAVRFGPALLYTQDGEDLEWSDELVLDPDTYIGPWDDPVQTDDGCWRFPEDGETAVQDEAPRYTLEPESSIGEDYDVYTVGMDGPCLPEGSYRFEDLGQQDLGVTDEDEEAPDLLFTLDIGIGESSELSAEARIEVLKPE